jgi:hypothetical protein
MTEEQHTGEETMAGDAGTDAADQGQQGSGNTTDAQGSGEAQSTDASKRIEVTADVLRAFRDEIRTLKDQNQLYKTQLQMSAQHAPAPAQHTMHPQGYQNQGVQNQGTGEIKFDLDDDDVVTGAELKKIVNTLRGSSTRPPEVNAEIERRIAMIELGQEDPQWQNTVKSFLPDVINTNPEIVDMIRVAPNPLKAALMFAKTNPKYAAQVKPKAGATKQDDLMSQIDKMIENAGKPTGGKAGSSPATSGASRYDAMSDEELDAHMEKVISGR